MQPLVTPGFKMIYVNTDGTRLNFQNSLVCHPPNSDIHEMRSMMSFTWSAFTNAGLLPASPTKTTLVSTWGNMSGEREKKKWKCYKEIQKHCWSNQFMEPDTIVNEQDNTLIYHPYHLVSGPGKFAPWRFLPFWSHSQRSQPAGSERSLQ